MNQQQTVLANNNYTPLSVFQQNKQAWENAIAAYAGEDPLELWFNYICWYEQNAAHDTENAFEAILGKCLSMYEYKDNFKQDTRMVKLWMKYIDLKPNALNLYQLLYQRDVGTQCTIFYIGWARYFESAGALKQAESVFNLGFQVNAQPYDELKAAHAKFRKALAQNMLYEDPVAATSAASKKRPASQLSDQLQQPQQQPAEAEHVQQQQAAQPAQQQQMQPSQHYQTQPQPDGDYHHQNHHDPQSQHGAEPAQTPVVAGEHDRSSPPPQQPQTKRPRTHHGHHHHHQHHGHSDGHQQQHHHHQQQQHDDNQPHAATNGHGSNDADAAAACAAAVVADESPHYPPPSDHGLNNSAHVITSSLYSVYEDGDAIADTETTSTTTTTTTTDGLPAAIQLPANFCAHVEHPTNDTWSVPLCLEEPFEPNKVCNYAKELVYPADDHREYSPEEIRARHWTEQLAALRERRLQHAAAADQQRLRDEADRQRAALELEHEARQRLELERLHSEAVEHERLRIAEQERARQAEYQRHAADVERKRLEAEQAQSEAAAAEAEAAAALQQQQQQQSYHHQQYYGGMNGDGDGGYHNNHHHHQHHHHHQQQQQHTNHHHNSTTTTTRSVIRTVGNGNVEEHIEASTIRFSTGNGQSKPKTITIKFRKEIPAAVQPETAVEVPGTYGGGETATAAAEAAAMDSSYASVASAASVTPKPKKEKKSKLAKRLLNGQHTASKAAAAAAAAEAAEAAASAAEAVAAEAAAAAASAQQHMEEIAAGAQHQPTSSDDSNFSYAGSTRHATPTAINNNNNQSRGFGDDEDDHHHNHHQSNHHHHRHHHNHHHLDESSNSNSYTNYPSSYGVTDNSNSGYTPRRGAAAIQQQDVCDRTQHQPATPATKRAFPAFATTHTSTPIRSAHAASAVAPASAAAAAASHPHARHAARSTATPKQPPHTPHNFKILKRRESSLSSSCHNDDSMCSLSSTSAHVNASFFAAEHDTELQQRRLETALATVRAHLERPLLDPFNSELCKALLTKIGFPSREHSDTYKLVSQPINKLANARTAMLANVPFHIDKEVGRGSYGSVYRATNANTGATVALKYQKPANNWELYICTEVHRRVTNADVMPGFMDISAGIVAPNASIIVSEFSPFGSLLDINNRIRQNTTKVMHESLVMHFSSQILHIIDHLHRCKIIHADIKPDNFLLMKIPDPNSDVPSIRLIDFGCAIDMKCFDEKTQFKKRIETDGFTCIEMQEGRPWSYQTDIFCIAGTIHVMLFGEYMQPVQKFGQWEIKNKLPRYLKKHIWSELFTSFLNIKDVDHLPDLLAMKAKIDDELYGMESELQKHIRTLSNILHKR